MKAPLSTPEPRALVEASDADSLIQGELEAAAFPDERLGKRLGVMLQQFADNTAQSVPLTCQDWANTKAAYRFFANERVTKEDTARISQHLLVIFYPEKKNTATF